MPQGDFYNNFLFSLAGLLVLYLSFCYLIRWTTYVYGPPLSVSWYFSSCSWNLIVKKKVKVSLIFFFILYSLKTKWTFFIWKTDLINGKIFNNLATLFLSLVSMGTNTLRLKVRWPPSSAPRLPQFCSVRILIPSPFCLFLDYLRGDGGGSHRGMLLKLPLI